MDDFIRYPFTALLLLCPMVFLILSTFHLDVGGVERFFVHYTYVWWARTHCIILHQDWVEIWLAIFLQCPRWERIGTGCLTGALEDEDLIRLLYIFIFMLDAFVEWKD
jgi:hypothetical protein